MLRIDLNADVGEGFAFDLDLFRIVTSANVCCGTHAGSPALTSETIEAALISGLTVGAHPSYPDRENFGRTSMPMGPDVSESIEEQLNLFAADAHPDYIKPHGALYNDAYTSTEVADLISSLAARHGCPVMGQAGSAMERACESLSVPFIREMFADRAYAADGTLVARNVDGSVLHDPVAIAERVLRVVTEGTVVTIDGTVIDVQADSICLHGDNPDALAIAEKVSDALNMADVEVTCPELLA